MNKYCRMCLVHRVHGLCVAVNAKESVQGLLTNQQCVIKCLQAIFDELSVHTSGNWIQTALSCGSHAKPSTATRRRPIAQGLSDYGQANRFPLSQARQIQDFYLSMPRKARLAPRESVYYYCPPPHNNYSPFVRAFATRLL